MEWISINDRLPETEETFIVYPSSKYFGMFAEFWPHNDFGEHQKNTFENANDVGDIFHPTVTHWMPLPAPPED